jgi:hypothetical protein
MKELPVPITGNKIIQQQYKTTTNVENLNQIRVYTVLVSETAEDFSIVMMMQYNGMKNQSSSILDMLRPIGGWV